MTAKTKWTTALSLSAIMMAGGLAQAQDQPEGAPGAGTITNETTTTTTTETDPGAVIITDADVATETMPDTGGAPLLMSLGGALLAGSALLLRRKIS